MPEILLILEELIPFFRFFFITLGSIYVCYRLLRLPKFSKRNAVNVLLFSFINGILVYLLDKISFVLCFLSTIVAIFLCIYMNYKTDKKVLFSTTIISFAISYILFSFSNVPVALIAAIFIYGETEFLFFPYIILCGVLELFFIWILFQIKYFRKGMPFLYQSESSFGGVLLSLAILISMLAFYLFPISEPALGFTWLFSFLILGIFLLSWWNARVRRAYREKLRLAEIASLRAELDELKQECGKIREDNDALARVIHKDNKMIPAMELAVKNFVERQGSRAEMSLMEQEGNDLTQQLEHLLTEREAVLSTYKKWTYTLPSTGIVVIDAILSFMEKKALALHTKFHVRLGQDVAGIAEAISTEDLAHLLSDLIENAIIAAKCSGDPSVLVYLGKLGEHFAIEIADNGADFAPSVYQDLGLRRHSTHLEEGGSGIGLMDIWKLKKKYRASLHITEYAPQEQDFTKKLTVMFDRKNHYIIETYRFDEVEEVHLRGDMYVLKKS